MLVIVDFILVLALFELRAENVGELPLVEIREIPLVAKARGEALVKLDELVDALLVAGEDNDLRRTHVKDY